MHIELINELNNATSLLASAMDRYTEACAAILRHFEPSGNSAEDLLESVMAECSRAFEYEEQLHQAMALMYRVRNQSPSFVPISVLPPEVISRIFLFSERCCLPGSRWKRGVQPNTPPVYPEAALEVCYHWRQIVLASHDLWSHIDIDTTSGSQGRLFSRASEFIAKSNQVRIDLHIRIDFYCPDDQRLFDFLYSIAPRIQSFNIQCDSRRRFHTQVESLLVGLFSRFVPGTLHSLCFNSQPEPGFLVTNDSIPSNHDPLLVRTVPLTESLFEGALSPVTSIQLDGMYPYWTSRAYVGLIELELENSQNCDFDIDITEVELANILRVSPGLRVFRFSLKISFESRTSLPPEPVKLDHLELIQLTGRHSNAQEAILRMTYPGRLPLQMSIEATENFSLLSPYWAQFVGFISRSKITQLRIQGLGSFDRATHEPFKLYLEPSEIFPLLPQLQVLTLCDIILGQACEEVLGDYDAISFQALLHDYNHGLFRQNLQFLRLVKCRIYWTDFRHMSELHPKQTLILDHCTTIKCRTRQRHYMFGLRWSWTDALLEAAMKICPGARVEIINGTTGVYEDLSESNPASTCTIEPIPCNNNTPAPSAFGQNVATFGSLFGA
ncbi:hypothetical protein ACGC1H_002509 [Rhizoctonia solani]|uniref:F-box-like domain protein n=1 Tax=Rhizoctonia solani TaxID=456999 RepID=A0A8H3AZ72_9AGAM|nr:unnamed protein product [Rhizoctonia solani]